MRHGRLRWFGHPGYKKDIKLLERVQQQVTKLVPELNELFWVFLHLSTGGYEVMSLKLTNMQCYFRSKYHFYSSFYSVHDEINLVLVQFLFF